MSRMVHHLKRALFGLARTSGMFSVVAGTGWRRGRLLILCYHGVSLRDEHEWNGSLYMSQAALRRRFELLRAGGYSVLALDEAVRRLAEGSLPDRAVALTFDDGTFDFLARAVPLLEEFGYPATVYVPTYYTRFRRPVFDTMVSYLAWKGRTRASCDLEGSLPGAGRLAVATGAERAATVARLHSLAAEQGLDAREKDALARRFAEGLGLDYDALLEQRVLQLMTADELEQLPRELVDVQLHTHRHRTPLDEGLFIREIDDNRRELASILGDDREFRHFCYPSGVYDPAFLPWLRASGVVSATTCDPGLARADGDPLLLPRFVDTMTQTETAFEAWTSGFAELVPRRTRVAGGATARHGVA